MSSSRWSPRRSAHTSTEAPWKSTFLSHIAKLESPEFVFASLGQSPDERANVGWVPRLRYCIYRGMWAELPENKHNDAPKNERIYESDLPTFTTDVRMGKVDGIFKSGWGRGGPEEIRGSGGGGAVEALWWIKDTGTQWRIKGQAFVVAPEIEGEGKQSEGIETLKSEVGERMRKVKEGNWSWGKELTAHFGNCSPKMRGTWKNPFPGAPVADVPPDDKHKLGQSITDLHDSVARKNFRVVIIKPVEVEQLDISDPAKARRWKYSYIRGNHNDNKADAADEGDWEWQTEELWP